MGITSTMPPSPPQMPPSPPQMLPPLPQLAPWDMPIDHSMIPPPMDAQMIPPPPAAPAVKVLRLEEALVEPELGSAEMPTIGSMGHRCGRCKPCAFVHTVGCSDGVDCKFCHLCEPGEKKKRRKEKLTYRKQMTQWRREMRQQQELLEQQELLQQQDAEENIDFWHCEQKSQLLPFGEAGYDSRRADCGQTHQHCSPDILRIL